MFGKTIVAALVATSMLFSAGSSFAGETYRGGPKSSPAISATARAAGPLAAYVPVRSDKASALGNRHGYQGGPKTVTPHER